MVQWAPSDLAHMPHQATPAEKLSAALPLPRFADDLTRAGPVLVTSSAPRRSKELNSRQTRLNLPSLTQVTSFLT